MGILGELWVKLGLKNDELNKGLDQSKQKVSGFAQYISKLGGMMAAAFSVKEIVKFTHEAANLANKTKGVKTAFERLGDPTLLEDLRKATQGTVDDLQLMQRAVQADNFGIPVKNLATYLEFATKRARETGQSVDYLVDSIITGLGRQSVMILDNLGISAAEIREKMKDGGSMADAVGKIIKKSMADSAAEVDNAALATDKLAAAWTNFKIAIGEGTSGFWNTLKTEAANYLEVITKIMNAEGFSWGEKLGMIFGGWNSNENVQKLLDQEAERAKVLKLATEVADDLISKVKTRKQAEDLLNRALLVQKGLNEKSSALEVETNKLVISGVKKWIENHDKKIAKQSQIIANLEEEIKKRKALRETATSEKQIEQYNKEIAKMEERLKVLQMTEKERKKYAKQKWENWNTEQEFEPLSKADKSLKNMAEFTVQTYMSLKNRSLRILKQFHKEQKNENAQAVQDAIDQQARMLEAVDVLNNAIQSGLSGSLGELANAIAGVNGANISSVVKALLSPLADACISAGLLVMGVGKAVEAFKTSLLTLQGPAAIAAGAALVAVGVAAKAGLAAIGKGAKGGSGAYGNNAVTSYSGGYGVNTNNYAQAASSYTLTTTLKGQDLLLAIQRTENNNRR